MPMNINFKNFFDSKISKASEVTVIAVGDSITWGLNHCTNEQTYCAELCRLFAQEYPDTEIERYDGFVTSEAEPLKYYEGPVSVQKGQKGKITIIRSGVGGNTVRRAINRADDFVSTAKTGKKPDIFLLMFGINDALRSDPNKYVPPEKFFEDYNELYDLITKTNPQAEIVFMTPTYFSQGKTRETSLDIYSDKVKILADQKKCLLIDTHKLWMDHLVLDSENNGQRDWLSNCQWDACHFSHVGSKATADFIFEKLMK